jgi:hypothetical protein
MKLSRFITLAFMLLLAINAIGQDTLSGYNPFVPKNLDDTLKLREVPVVESSYHRYWIKGDPNYTDTSTYVWYVENGTFGMYDSIHDIWVSMIGQSLGQGYFIELRGETVDSTRNASQIWVRWNDGTGGDSIGYVAVYERSSDNCVVDDDISGFKHEILPPPEVWFVVGNREECSGQKYSVRVMFNNINDFSFPYKLVYTYPDSIGVYKSGSLQINSRAELDASLSYTFDLSAVQDLNVTADEQYFVRLDSLRDKYSSVGKIAPEGPPQEYAQLTFTNYHLPQTGGMTMDSIWAQQIPKPKPYWPLDSVVNGSVHYFTVPGDTNYAEPSSFVWKVEGGRLFYDQALTSMAGDGTVATVKGNSENITQLWVIWDSFDTPLDTGFIYVYEISADGCQRSDMDTGKFQGMRIKVSSPPNVRFITDRTIACSDSDSAKIILEIDGMPPYDLLYSVNYEQKTWHITAADLADLDGNDTVNNVAFYFRGLDTITSDMTYIYQLDTVSSGGVYGHILQYSSHELIVHVRPPAPSIVHEWTEVTAGTTKTYHLIDTTNHQNEWYWTLWNDVITDPPLNNYQSTSKSSYDVTFNYPPGWYHVDAQYRDDYGCLSPFDSLNIQLFGIPTIAFSDSTPDVINCSAVMPLPDGQFEFVVEYTGARTYGYTYEVYNYYSDVPEYTGVIDYRNNRSDTIHIDNTFINYTEQNQPWRVVITEAHNEEPGVNVNITDSVRVIMIYPKPIIYDDIDFAN